MRGIWWRNKRALIERNSWTLRPTTISYSGSPLFGQQMRRISEMWTQRQANIFQLKKHVADVNDKLNCAHTHTSQLSIFNMNHEQRSAVFGWKMLRSAILWFHLMRATWNYNDSYCTGEKQKHFNWQFSYTQVLEFQTVHHFIYVNQDKCKEMERQRQW